MNPGGLCCLIPFKCFGVIEQNIRGIFWGDILIIYVFLVYYVFSILFLVVEV
jgi:hypothetical protein